MELASTVINDILGEILQKESEQITESVDSNAVMRYMNRFMAGLAVKSPLGYTEVKSLVDPITIPDGAIEGLIFNTALRIVTSYDITPNPILFGNAKDSLETMIHLASRPIMTSRPETLPVGSGNDDGLFNRRFFPPQENTLLDEQGGAILLESNT